MNDWSNIMKRKTIWPVHFWGRPPAKNEAVDKRAQIRKTVDTSARKYADRVKCRWLQHRFQLQRGVLTLVEVLAIAGYLAVEISDKPPELVMVSAVYFAVCTFSIYDTVFKLRTVWEMRLQSRAEVVWDKTYREKIQEYTAVCAELGDADCLDEVSSNSGVL